MPPLASKLPENAGYDAAALRIADRIRSSLDLDAVLQYTVDELGSATGVARSLLQLAPGSDGKSLLVEWDRGDTHPLGVRPPTPIARRVFDTCKPLVFEHLDEADEEAAAYLGSVGACSVVSIPVRWRQDVVAALSLQDTRRRNWSDVRPLLERLEGQVGAALAQAILYESQEEALRQLRDLDRLRDELLANVSHELRTPLTGIVGSIQTLRRTDVTLSDDRRAEMLELMEDQAHRLAQLTDDILDLSRVTRGKQRLRLVPVRLCDLVERARGELERPDGREIALEIEEDVAVEVDRNRMGQVVANLLQNALRHGDGRITVRCGRERDTAVLAVADEGPGVAEGYEEEMFAPFSHASDRADSTGLGLSIARAIVEAHGGTLTYNRAGEGRPHEFLVTLPLGEAG